MANSQKVSLIGDIDGTPDVEVKVTNFPTSIKVNNTSSSPIPVSLPLDNVLSTSPCLNNVFVCVTAGNIIDRFNFVTRIVDRTSMRQFCRGLWPFYYPDGYDDHELHTMKINLYIVYNGVPSDRYDYCTYTVQDCDIRDFIYNGIPL